MTDDSRETHNLESFYFQNDLDAFQNGVRLDLRVRLAIDLLKSSPLFGVPSLAALPSDRIIAFALGLANDLLAQASERGWLKPLSETAHLSASLRYQAGRLARFQLLQQIEAQRGAREESASIAVPVGAVAPGIKLS